MKPTIFHYHPVTGEFLGTGEPQASPKEPEKWLYPAHCTLTAPPDEQAGHVRAWDGSQWLQVPLPEPEPEPEPEPVRDWAGLATRMNANIDWLRLVRGNGAAAELARYVSLQDVENARAYWIFLDSEGDLPESLKEDIAAAAIACNLGDLFGQISGDPV